MKAIRYRITLLEPTLVASFGGAPDSVESFDYLPGSVLRGVFIGSYMRQHKIKELDAIDPTVRRLFFDGSTRFLNGYPLDRLDNRMMPTPYSWRNKKGNETPVFDLALKDALAAEDDLKPVGTPFCSVSSEEVKLHRPEKLLTIHTRRTRRFGRAVSGAKLKLEAEDIEGAIYRYEALQAGQQFEAVILCDQDDDADTLEHCISNTVLLGKSRSGGYGRASLELLDIEDNWSEIGGGPHQTPFIVTLLSDALIRDEAGQYTADDKVVEGLLAHKLGINLSLRDAFLKTQIIGGFNRKWGFPLPQAQALQAGSVLVFDTDEVPDEEKLALLLWQGIGERRAEGFGRVAVNWQTADELTIDTILLEKPVRSTAITSDDAQEVGQRMLQRMLDQRLESALVQRANELGDKITKPSKSQLNGLRAVIQQALRQTPDEGRRAIENYLNSLEERKTTREQFGRDRIDGGTIIEWVRKRASDKTQIWQELNIDKTLQLGDLQAKLDASQAYEYNLRLVDAVLARAAKSKGGDR